MLCLLLAGQAFAGERDAPSIHSGIYEGLMLAVAPDGAIQGSFRERQGEGVVKSCAFFLSGKLSGAGGTSVVTWAAQSLPGTISATSEGVRLAIPQGREHAGCGLVLLPQIDDGIDLDLTRDAKWIGLSRITGAKVNFRAKPGDAAELRAYVVRNDIVGVISRQSDWLQIEFVNDRGKASIGWIPASQTAPLSVP